MRGIESASEKDAGGGRASLETRAPRLARQKVFRRPSDLPCRSLPMRRDPFSSFPPLRVAVGGYPGGWRAGMGWDTHLFSNASAQCGASFLASFLLVGRGARAGRVSGSTGERPENGQRVEKSGESVRGGTHLGPQRPPSGAHAEKRDMLAMSVKLAGSGARVHVRRVSRARANARMRVMSLSHPRTIFWA
jgi:hypothetical protein